MTAESVVEAAFLAIAVAGLTVQLWGLTGMRRHRPQPQARGGLTRTIVCRVFASTVYVLVGINAATLRVSVVIVSLSAFGITQLLWTVNTVMDRRIAKPRRPRFIQVTVIRKPPLEGGS